MCADARQEMMVAAANSENIGPIIIWLMELGYPKDITSLDVLTVAQRGRFRLWHIAANNLGDHAISTDNPE